MRHSRFSKPSAMPTSCLLSLSKIIPKQSPDRHCPEPIPWKSYGDAILLIARRWRLGPEEKSASMMSPTVPSDVAVVTAPSSFPTKKSWPLFTTTLNHFLLIARALYIYLRPRLPCCTYVYCLNSPHPHLLCPIWNPYKIVRC